ncbi:hypothetical protein BKA70DRAFT_1239158 [Coprinopsis sp. MPI-PUGE-AT-0042]|nr:hypothetical protein BKA70DRAFT_1239158 [Coprinopsis sp. MPI-PUGE-AT-0042]
MSEVNPESLGNPATFFGHMKPPILETNHRTAMKMCRVFEPRGQATPTQAPVSKDSIFSLAMPSVEGGQITKSVAVPQELATETRCSNYQVCCLFCKSWLPTPGHHTNEGTLKQQAMPTKVAMSTTALFLNCVEFVQGPQITNNLRITQRHNPTVTFQTNMAATPSTPPPKPGHEFPTFASPSNKSTTSSVFTQDLTLVESIASTVASSSTSNTLTLIDFAKGYSALRSSTGLRSKAILKPLPPAVINSMKDAEVQEILNILTSRWKEQVEAEERVAKARLAYHELFFIQQSLERHCSALDENKKRLVLEAMNHWKTLSVFPVGGSA